MCVIFHVNLGGKMSEVKRRGRKRKFKGICPVCGQPYSWIETKMIGSQVYYYYVHYMGVEGKKKRVRKCYLGPQSYIYVSKLHEKERLVLRGLVDKDRGIEYLRALINWLEITELDKNTALQLAKLFERAAKILRDKYEK